MLPWPPQGLLGHALTSSTSAVCCPAAAHLFIYSTQSQNKFAKRETRVVGSVLARELPRSLAARNGG